MTKRTRKPSEPPPLPASSVEPSATEQSLSQDAVDVMAAARQPFDVLTAIRLSVGTPVVLSWYDGGSRFSAGKVVGGDKKTKVQIVAWPSEGGTMGIMLCPDKVTERVLVDQRHGREFLVYAPNASERASIAGAEKKSAVVAPGDVDHAPRRRSGGSYEFTFKPGWRDIKGMTKQGVALLALVEAADVKDTVGEDHLASILEAGRETLGVTPDRNLVSLFKAHLGWTYAKFELVKKHE